MVGVGSGFRRDNHYIAADYLKRWADGEGRVWTYRQLVSNEAVHEWRRHSVKGVGYHEYLYAQHVDGAASDAVERWLAEKVDSPSARVLEKVALEERLAGDDWDTILRFFAASMVRTPAFLVRSMPRWEQDLPGILEASLKRGSEVLEGKRPVSPPGDPGLGGGVVAPPFGVRVRRASGGEGGIVEARAVAGRVMWLTSIHRLVSHTYKQLHGSHWTILRAPDGRHWPTSDDPALMAILLPSGEYAFGGGWAVKGTLMLLPLNPRHILLSVVGSRPQQKYTTVDGDAAEAMRKLIVAHSHRLVFAVAPDSWIASVRPRRIDASAFERERDEWAKWGGEQSRAERDLEDDDSWKTGDAG
jgi:hypothetical protein